MKLLLLTAVALLPVAALAANTAPGTTTETNVLQNISIDLTLYEQGPTNANGTKVSDKANPFHTRDLINALSAATGTNFGNDAKLVISTIYSAVTNVVGLPQYSTLLSTNLALAPGVGTNTGELVIGTTQLYGPLSTVGVITIDGDVINSISATLTTNIIRSPDNTNEYVVINTNAGYITTIIPSTNNSGQVTNANVVLQQQTASAPTQVVITNISSSIGILYGPANTFAPVDANISFSLSSPQIVAETGNNLNTTNALTVSNFTAESAVSLQTLNIAYFTPGTSNNLNLTLTGFVKQTLKVDRIGKTVAEDIFGANASWNAVGAGTTGGSLSTNEGNPVLTNANPVVAEGSITISFLKNLVQ